MVKLLLYSFLLFVPVATFASPMGPVLDNRTLYTNTCQLVPNDSCTLQLGGTDTVLHSMYIQSQGGSNTSDSYWLCSNTADGGSVFYGEHSSVYVNGIDYVQAFTNLDFVCGQTFFVQAGDEYMNITVAYSRPQIDIATSSAVNYYDWISVNSWIVFFLAVGAFSTISVLIYKKT